MGFKKVQIGAVTKQNGQKVIVVKVTMNTGVIVYKGTVDFTKIFIKGGFIGGAIATVVNFLG